ncbi:hypothetical protein Nepgr_030916 [Nepenthes gracilis]|uniref:Uncharacterized protein n=1 Tax=Nepenthes gracilis TaxID=150966 RepID=A0AAD3TFN5_NEPGR|nr:hypothetical protein Nepgr_030916 [Nepenthes gracilis]
MGRATFSPMLASWSVFARFNDEVSSSLVMDDQSWHVCIRECSSEGCRLRASTGGESTDAVEVWSLLLFKAHLCAAVYCLGDACPKPCLVYPKLVLVLGAAE